MSDPDEPRLSTEEVSTGKPVERRRPGRRSTVAPNLVPLLRSPAEIEIPDDGEADAIDDPLHHDNLGAAKGIIVSLAICAAFWTLMDLLVAFVRMKR